MPEKQALWSREDLAKELFHVVKILCETRGHEGRRPCEFCTDMHLWKIRGENYQLVPWTHPITGDEL